MQTDKQTVDSLIAAFKAGAKFEVRGRSGLADGPVTRLFASTSPGIIAAATTGSFVTLFRASDGVPTYSTGARLKLVAPANQPDQPLLKRLLNGETFHVPATRETLVKVEFVQGGLRYTLKGETGAERRSENYDHEGKHKWQPTRTLVAGPVPPKVTKDVSVGVYLFESVSKPGSFIAAVQGELVNYKLWRQVGYGNVIAQGKQRA